MILTISLNQTKQYLNAITRDMPTIIYIYCVGEVKYRCPNITKQNNENVHNAIREMSKGDFIIMGDFNHEVLNGIHYRAQG